MSIQLLFCEYLMIFGKMTSMENLVSEYETLILRISQHPDHFEKQIGYWAKMSSSSRFVIILAMNFEILSFDGETFVFLCILFTQSDYHLFDEVVQQLSDPKDSRFSQQTSLVHIKFLLRRYLKILSMGKIGSLLELFSWFQTIIILASSFENQESHSH